MKSDIQLTLIIETLTSSSILISSYKAERKRIIFLSFPKGASWGLRPARTPTEVIY